MPEHLISTQEFCTLYQVEYSFINSLQQHGLIEITTIDQHSFIDHDHLKNVEKLVRLHYDLDINLEGIEAITYLLNKVNNMQAEIMELKNKLSLYENEEEF
jgi:chaperone modulatory protein CbpM